MNSLVILENFKFLIPAETRFWSCIPHNECPREHYTLPEFTATIEVQREEKTEMVKHDLKQKLIVEFWQQ